MVLLKASIVVLSMLVFLVPGSESACHGSRTSYRAEFSGKLVQDNKVLFGHVFANYSVQNFTHCFALCKDDCRCRSFNLPMTGQGVCELNSADNTTVLMVARRGWRYHHLGVLEVRQGANTCYEPYSNGCCEPNPCQQSSTCAEVGDRGKPGFDCNCTTEGYLGPFCHRKIHSCLDYLWNDKDASSGYYDIWSKDADTKYRVFCDMRPDQFEAWTLVMSYTYSVKDMFAEKPLFANYPSNEALPTSGSYRLSRNTMDRVLDGLGTDRPLEWRTTCSYSFVLGRTTNDEIVRSRFDTLDIMTFTTNEKGLVGYYPFTNVTTNQDKSGFNNHATFYDITYEDGPLGIKGGSARMSGSTSSYIRLNDNSGKLDTRYSLTIMMQIYPFVSNEAQLLGWAQEYAWGVRLWQANGDLFWKTEARDSTGTIGHVSVPGLGNNMWNYVTVTYDYENGRQAAYVNGTLLKSLSVTPRELRTQNNYPLSIGVKLGDSRVYDGRVACLRIYNTAFTDDDVKRMTKDWRCPEDPEPICHRVNYINVRGRECYDCTVWATQTNTEAFTINAHRGDQNNGCNFKSGSTVSGENIFGVYKTADTSTHACSSSATATTDLWFGGRL